MNQKTSEVQIKPAKGRPMLTWVGKRPLRNVIAYPAQLVEKYGTNNKTGDMQSDIWHDWPADYPKGGLLFHGDNKEVLAHLLANGFRGKAKLVYIDPPFDSGADYIRRITLRGVTGNSIIEGENYNLGEQIQYTDIWANDNYLQFMYERLLLIKELLSEEGSLYLHCDTHRTHHLRCLIEEIFGSENLRNEIIWQRFNFRADGKKFGTVHDTIYLVTKSDSYVFQKPFISLKPSYIKTHFRPDENGRLFRLDNPTAPGHGKTGKPILFGDRLISPPPGAMWRFKQDTIDDLMKKGLIVMNEAGLPSIKRYLDEIEGQAVHSIWTDVRLINSQSTERTNYNTQKPEEMVERIIETSSVPGDIVLDCFIGSGTTAAVAQKLGRRWIGCDINKGAIQTSSKRLSDVLKDQVKASKVPKSPQLLPLDDGQEEQPEPAQLSFAVFKVNDYDLQIQHNEAVNLACEHIGITRTKTDAFFDGVLGKRLVKIIPFNHPLSPLDLEEIKNELGNRPEEARDIVVVSLGKEMAVDVWIEEWNRLRKQGDFPNKVDVIELRSDPRYGGFFTHQPAQAQVKIQRTEKGIEVTIEAFISPTIIERLKQQAGLLSPQIDDWRAMVDSVMIDPDYDGKVFNVVIADVPAKKSDLVAGKYLLPELEKKTTVAVKITDMLGEEVLVNQKI